MFFLKQELLIGFFVLVIVRVRVRLPILPVLDRAYVSLSDRLAFDLALIPLSDRLALHLEPSSRTGVISFSGWTSLSHVSGTSGTSGRPSCNKQNNVLFR